MVTYRFGPRGKPNPLRIEFMTKSFESVSQSEPGVSSKHLVPNVEKDSFILDRFSMIDE